MTMDTAAPAMGSARSVRRYHPALVVLHWTIAALIFITAILAMGGEGRGRRLLAAVGMAGIPTLTFHMILGITVLVLLFVRLLMRWRLKNPAWATAGNAFLDLVGRWTHIGLYFFAFAVTITGLVLALQTNRLARAFEAPGPTSGQFRPGQLPTPPGGFQPGQFPPNGGFRPGGGGGEGGEGFGSGRFFLGAFHGVSWTLLVVLIILHVGAALYHQFLRGDNLFARMWFGRTT
jgi:cytochrome b561